MTSASGWHHAEGADPVGTVALLNAAKNLALGEYQVGRHRQDHGEDQAELDQDQGEGDQQIAHVWSSLVRVHSW